MSDPSSDTDTPALSDLSIQEATASRGAWLDKRSACQTLGVVEKTIERRVARGEIPRQIVNGRVLFWIEGAESDMSIDTDTPDSRQDAHSVALALFQQLPDLMSHLSDLARQEQAPLLRALEASYAMQREQVEEICRLRAELEAAQRRESVSIDRSDRRSWWRRLFRMPGPAD